jgi:hypothetical protein
VEFLYIVIYDSCLHVRKSVTSNRLDYAQVMRTLGMEENMRELNYPVRRSHRAGLMGP